MSPVWHFTFNITEFLDLESLNYKMIEKENAFNA